MKQLLSAAQMREADRYTYDEFGLDVLILMERAALALSEAVIKRLDSDVSVFVMSGVGNNGADGLAAARILKQRGFNVSVLVIGNIKKATAQWSYQRRLVDKLNIEVQVCESEEQLDDSCFPKAEAYIDALFGIGLSRPLSGVYATAVDMWNRHASACGALRVAADICSGIDATSGAVLGCAVSADLTVTFGFAKVGQYLYPGAEHAGKLKVAEVGFAIDAKAAFGGDCLWVMDEEDAADLLPKRVPWGSKSDFGRVVILAGSSGMAGAAYLSARAAYLSGAGLVYIITEEENRQILQTLLPQAVLKLYSKEKLAPEGAAEKFIKDTLRGADACVAGPGLSKGALKTQLLKAMLDNHGSIPLVLDADALNILSDNRDWTVGENVILTPHPGELSRLMCREISDLKLNMPAAARDLAEKYKAVSVCKDARTFIVDGQRLCLNVTGNDGMAAGGSGDILTGIIAALAAQGLSAGDAARLGVWLHGSAGDFAAEEKSRYSMTAEDILTGIAKAIKRLQQALLRRKR